MFLQKSLLNISISIVSMFTLGACSSVMETPNQQIEIVTPGTTHALCEVVIGAAIYQARPPQTITVLKTKNPITVNCAAPGNRDASTTVESKVATATFANILNGGAGAIYDFGSGAMFEYPEKISVDFTNIAPKAYPLPSYHLPNVLPQGYEPGIESTGPKEYQTLKSSRHTKRMATMNEREIRKLEVEYGGKGEQSKGIPALSPYFPEDTFSGTTSF